jgi:uncharacterized membrane protein YhaH (DUF805 family)
VGGFVSRFLFSFRGYADRSEFWRVYFFVLLPAGFALGLIALPLFSLLGAAAFAVLAALVLALVVISTAVNVRRLHDRGRSGAWVLVMFVPPLVVAMTGQTAYWIVSAPVLLWWLIDLGIMPGVSNKDSAPPVDAPLRSPARVEPAMPSSYRVSAALDTAIAAQNLRGSVKPAIIPANRVLKPQPTERPAAPSVFGRRVTR